MNKTFIIAEMSANHCGDIELAKKIIDKAKECGADAIKLQTYTADTMTIDCRNDYFKISEGVLWDDKYYYDLYGEAYTPWEWQGELKKYADDIGIELFSTPFDKTAVDFLESINVNYYKIASFEAIDYNLIKYAASKQKPMIISCGISSFDEIQEAVDACKFVGNLDITLLKCTSAYPAKLEDMNLSTIPDMTKKFGLQGVKIGLSDHSMHIETAVAAVALGAKVVEKHFTLDRALGGADATFSLNPAEFKATVEAIRNTEKLIGHVDYSVNEKNRKFARSLFVCEDIKKGERLTDKNIRSIRPSDGLHPRYYDNVIEKTARRDLARGTPLRLEDVKGKQCTKQIKKIFGLVNLEENISKETIA
ncbi:MAG: pseudaminic acid synthase [Holosporaceae bacterium]|nr:pseudaminic acid synthase [Holosporaceae bacterium]